MLKKLTTIPIALILCLSGFALAETGEPNYQGSHIEKVRQKGKILTRIHWSNLPPFMDENMGMPGQIRIINLNIPVKDFFVQFSTGKKILREEKYNIDKDYRVDKSFNLTNFYYQFAAGKKGSIILRTKDGKGKEILKKIIEVRGKSG